jgi:hypothetical protein
MTIFGLQCFLEENRRLNNTVVYDQQNALTYSARYINTVH